MAKPRAAKAASRPVREGLVRIAAIDIGSNGIRMTICQVNEGFKLVTLKNLREAVRLGRDVFTERHISERTMERAVRALAGFRVHMDKLGVSLYRAVATSATREAENRDLFVDRVKLETGLELNVIGGEEEARLVHLAVSRRLNLGDRLTLLIDIGGGSVELVLARSDRVLAIESLKMGTVRMLSRLQERGAPPDQFHQLAREYVVATRSWIEKRLVPPFPSVVVGTGGNVEALGDLTRRLFQKPSEDRMHLEELEDVTQRLESLNLTDRIKQFQLRVDRADVIVPAAIVICTLMAQLHADEILVPRVGLKDGVIEDLVDDHFRSRQNRLHSHQVMAAAQQLGRKYQFDERHGQKVVELSLQLFDQTQAQHQLSEDYRFLLEVAALLHDIGKFINFSSHHKHSHYIIASTPIVGLTDQQRAVVACIARYHRKSVPSMQHPFFRELPPADRMAVTKLSAILRLAEALDAEHESRVEGIRLKATGKNRAQLELIGSGDLLLEKWSLQSKSGVFDKALGLKLTVPN